MERIIRIIAVAIAAFVFATTTATAQNDYGYSYYVQRTIPINWKPETKFRQQYTVAVHPLHSVNNGLKFDFEYQLSDPSKWLQVGVMAYIAPELNYRDDEEYGYFHPRNGRYTMNSGYHKYKHMWGLGTSILFKEMFHTRGWYFSTGLMFHFYRVGHEEHGYVPYTEDGLTFYEQKAYTLKTSFFKPSAQFNLGKHFSLSKRVFLDTFIGLSYSYSFYNRDHFAKNEYDKYRDLTGFAYRGLSPNFGLRIGVLLWDKQ